MDASSPCRIECAFQESFTSFWCTSLVEGRRTVQLEATELFSGLSQDFLGRVRHLAEVCKYSSDESIFYEGDPAEDIFILREGKVELTYSLPQDPTTEIRITHILPGENFA